MSDTQLYFLSDFCLKDYPDQTLTEKGAAKEQNGQKQPCFLAFPDSQNPEIFWSVPVTFRTKKYKPIHQKAVQRYGKCNTLCFGPVLNREATFLIQDMIPVSKNDLIPYLDKSGQPIRIQENLAHEVINNAKTVLALTKRGYQLTFTDLMKHYEKLDKQIKGETI